MTLTIRTTPIVLVLIALKALKVLDISWWLVFSPWWVPLALVFGFYLTIFILAIFGAIFIE